MKAEDEPITLLGVAKSAGVSNWLVYAEGVREHIEAARRFCYRSYPVDDTRARYRTLAEDHGGEVLHETAGRVPRACLASSRRRGVDDGVPARQRCPGRRWRRPNVLVRRPGSDQKPGGGLVTAGVNEASLVHLLHTYSNTPELLTKPGVTALDSPEGRPTRRADATEHRAGLAAV